jgi:hypothetical protein
MASDVQPAREALDVAVRMRHTAKMTASQDKPTQLDARNRPLKTHVTAQDSAGGSPGGTKLSVSGASDHRPSMLKIPGFMSARCESSFAAVASLGADRPLSASAAHASNKSLMRGRLVEPVDSRNPRVGRGMAKIYSGDMHAIRCVLASCSALVKS